MAVDDAAPRFWLRRSRDDELADMATALFGRPVGVEVFATG